MSHTVQLVVCFTCTVVFTLFLSLNAREFDVCVCVGGHHEILLVACSITRLFVCVSVHNFSVVSLLGRCEIVRNGMRTPCADEVLFITPRDRLLLSVICFNRPPDEVAV